MTALEVQAIHRARREALLTDGTLLPITELMDLDGDETDDWDEAVTFVAGQGAVWVVDAVANFPAGDVRGRN